MQIRLVSILGGAVDVVPQMLAHYQAAGIERFHLVVHTPSARDPLRADIDAILSAAGLSAERYVVGPWHEALNRDLYRSVMGGHPTEWFVVADLDEFQLYSEALAELVRYCDAHDYDYVEGCFLDRLAGDGSFPPVGLGPLWGQYPLAGFVALPLTGATPTKVVLARGGLLLGYGQHWAESGRGCPAGSRYVQVHHFKWAGSVVGRMADRAARYASGEWRTVYDTTRQEAMRFVAYVTGNGGRIDVTDPRFLLAPCADRFADYPHWDRVRARVRTFQAARAAGTVETQT